MIDWKCKNCNEERKHKVEKTGQDKYRDYKILVCQYCSEKEMVPEKALGNDKDIEDKNESKESKIAVDGGFDREVDPSCESGICGAR